MNKRYLKIYLETKVNPNGGAEIFVRCNDECMSNFNVIPFIACISIAVKDDLSFLVNLDSLIKR
ncbi:hypothetical protein V4V24_09285 [Bacillus thuringiensis]|uniref:Uncharacterized protein n=3 Tax=Bacillus cereus group TaxID=86661 RepID=A0A9X7GTS3_BACCE|nr:MULTISPECIES: hypothetical protein [Bacillus cereus group]OTZ68916.1 hypothetical protein BK769_28740 [Bacillus thuringiensis serovar kumamtoensis]OUB35555.1 hypothetical protein BK739_00810 [Bacillus thuringiensis serovar pirenaica]KXY36125.1 hypothetical protein AT268_34170 [Bacillus cereus]MBN9898593.1 hypothetical protein [Bacillus thuringiensis]MDY7518440.1 hypothetical protein [Bacillus thuringiensis]